MVVQVAPVEKNAGETVCSLVFAQRVRTVELGQATKKTESAATAQLKDRLREYEVGLVWKLNFLTFFLPFKLVVLWALFLVPFQTCCCCSVSFPAPFFLGS